MRQLPEIKGVLLLVLISFSSLSAAFPQVSSKVPDYSWAGAWQGKFWSSNLLAEDIPFTMVLTHSGNVVEGTIVWTQNGVQYKGTLLGTVTVETVDGANYSNVRGNFAYVYQDEPIIQDFLMSVLLPPQGDGSEFNGGHGDDAAAHWIGTRSDKIPRTHLPVIFIPGIAGTELNYGDTQVWPIPYNNVLWAKTQGDTILLRIGLAADGKTPYDISTTPATATVSHGDIIRSGWADTYGTMIAALEASPLKYVEGKDLFIFGYDWRLDNKEHLKPLDDLIDHALELNGVDKVVLIAHSMGGVISRAYILSDTSRAAKVDALISIGTPFWGAPKVFYALAMGYNFADPFFTQMRMKYVLQNFTSGYELLPREPFIYDISTNTMLGLEQVYSMLYKGFEYANPGDYFKRHNLTETRGLLSDKHWTHMEDGPNHTIVWVYNVRKDYFPSDSNIYSLNHAGGALVNAANDFYKPVGTPENATMFPDSVKHYAIVGYGFPTVTKYYMRDAEPRESYVELASGRKVVLWPIFESGDGQVPWWSSRASQTSATFGTGMMYLIANGDGGSSMHGELTKNTKVQSIVVSILDGQPLKPEVGEGEATEGDGVDYSIHSDAHLSIRNIETGSVLGYNQYGCIEENTVGSFLSMESGEYASVSGVEGQYEVTVNGIRSGNFTLDLKVRKAGESIEFAYPEIEVENGTVASFVYEPSIVTTGLTPVLTVTTGDTTKKVEAVILSTRATGSLVVTVKDSSGAKISGATVSSTSLPTGQNSLIGTSGVDGTVSFNGVAAGSYTLQASKSGYLAATGSGSVSAGSAGSISITIQAQQSSGGGGGGVPGFPLEATILGVMLVLTIMLARKRIPEK